MVIEALALILIAAMLVCLWAIDKLLSVPFDKTGRK